MRLQGTHQNTHMSILGFCHFGGFAHFGDFGDFGDFGVSAKVVFWDTPAKCTCKTPLISLCKHKGVLGEVV